MDFMLGERKGTAPGRGPFGAAVWCIKVGHAIKHALEAPSQLHRLPLKPAGCGWSTVKVVKLCQRVSSHNVRIVQGPLGPGWLPTPPLSPAVAVGFLLHRSGLKVALASGWVAEDLVGAHEQYKLLLRNFGVAFGRVRAVWVQQLGLHPKRLFDFLLRCGAGDAQDIKAAGLGMRPRRGCSAEQPGPTRGRLQGIARQARSHHIPCGAKQQHAYFFQMSAMQRTHQQRALHGWFLHGDGCKMHSIADSLLM